MKLNIKKEYYYLLEDQIKKGMQLCVKKIKYILCSVKILCNDNGLNPCRLLIHLQLKDSVKCCYYRESIRILKEMYY